MELNPFNIPIIIEKIDDVDFISELKNICLEKNKQYKDLTDTEWKNYNVFDWNYPEIKELELKFADIVKKFFIKYSPIEIKQFTFQGWVNVRYNQSRHKIHGHGQADLVLNFYVSCPKNSQIIYYNPNIAMTERIWLDNTLSHTVNVEEGMLVITPPWLLHEVPETNSSEPRISISVNVKVEI